MDVSIYNYNTILKGLVENICLMISHYYYFCFYNYFLNFFFSKNNLIGNQAKFGKKKYFLDIKLPNLKVIEIQQLLFLDLKNK